MHRAMVSVRRQETRGNAGCKYRVCLEARCNRGVMEIEELDQTHRRFQAKALRRSNVS
jgi:hypothetical protein